MLSWPAAFVIAAVLVAGAAVVGRRGRSRFAVAAVPYLREAAVVFALYGVWQLALDAAVVRTSGAARRGEWVWRAERTLRLPSELTLERWGLRHRLFMEAANDYYAIVHFPALIAFLVWLFARHR